MRAKLLWFVCGTFQIFVTVATWVGLTQIIHIQLNRQTLKTPIWRKNLNDISHTSWVIADFVIKFTNFCYHGNKGFQNFRYHGNRGWSDTNFTHTVKSADPENPHLAQESWWYLIHKLSYSRFSDKIYQICYHGNKGGSSENLSDSVWSANPQNPQFGAKFWDLS